MLPSRLMLLPLLFTLLIHAAPRPCDVTLVADGNTAAIQVALDRTDKPVICLKPGKYLGARFVVAQSATLQRLGTGEVILDAGGQGRVLTLPKAGVRLALAADLNDKPRLLVRDSLVLGAPNAFNVPQRQAENVEVLRSVVSGRIGFVSLDLASKRDAPQLDALGLERAMPAVASPAIDLAHCDLPEQKLDLTGRPRGKRCTAGAFEPSLEVVRHTRWLRANPKR